jgi:hypothetical protein
VEPIERELQLVLSEPTGVSRAGHPYLTHAAYARFRDRVPHILAMGPRALAALERIAQPEHENAAKVVRGCVMTAAITAPSDLWLLRYVIPTLAQAGIVERLMRGETIDAVNTPGFDGRELDADLTFVLSRGLVALDEQRRFRAPDHPRARATLTAFSSPPPWPADVSRIWAALFRGETLDDAARAALHAIGTDPPMRTDPSQDTWIPTADEIETGARLLPLVLGLRAAGAHERLANDTALKIEELAGHDRQSAKAAENVLVAAGVLDENGRITVTGKRVAEKGAGPMGIIEAYHPYMARLGDILRHGRGQAWVTRSANIAASQDANRESFTRANDALDRFCADTGFQLSVFIEHAIGRGEATRQRYARPGGASLRYFGADLEDAAIDACLEEQRKGNLPQNMVFVRHADIGEPRILVDAIRAAGADPYGAVMIVGNGFHEVRNQSDERMIAVFRDYAQAGVLLLFTEESALRIDDLLATAWNTYHAGFRYVHEKSGQGLRPAEPAPPSSLGRSLGKSWRECAEAAGYVRIERYSSRSRTIYPLAPTGGYNPSISANHFCVPRPIAERLGNVGRENPPLPLAPSPPGGEGERG